VLVNLIDRRMNVQQAIEAPRYRYINGNGVLLEDELTDAVISRLIERGHRRTRPDAGYTVRAQMGGGQAIMIDFATGTLMGGSDPRKDGLALGY
jgi:gamma-glutamyltranspeptidase/glutathione hydrolase